MHSCRALELDLSLSPGGKRKEWPADTPLRIAAATAGAAARLSIPFLPEVA